jgi:hypothetical protein
MAIMTRDNFADLLTPIHRMIFFNAYAEKPEQYSELFKTITMNKYTETFPHVYGMGAWDSNSEGQTFNTDAMEDGPNATLTAVRYDKSYSVTWEMVEDNLYSEVSPLKGYGTNGSAQALGSGLRTKIEQICAAVINGGFAAACYDGQYLFDSDHPTASSTGGTTDSNLGSGALTDTTLKAALLTLESQIDGAGNKINAVADKVFGSASLRYTIYEILRSGNIAGELSNTSNTLPAMRPVINNYLTAGYWGVMDSSFKNLLFAWRSMPIFGSEKIANTMDYRFYGATRFDADAVDYRGIVASPGS